MSRNGTAVLEPVAKSDVEAELELLKELIEEHFPAEAACVEISNREEVVRLTRLLLDRLWRWEN